MIMSGNLLSKDPTGAKKLFEFARVTKKDSIYVTESPERKEDIAYRRLSLDWYAKLPPPIKIETVTSIEQICQYVYTSKTVMIYVLHGDKGCDQKFSLQTMILPSATVYY